MTDKTRKRESGKHLKEIATPVERHDADDPDTDTGPSSVVEALPTEDSTAELTRKKIWGWWHQSKQDFGRAHTQSFVRDAIQKAIDAEKAELSRQLEELREENAMNYQLRCKHFAKLAEATRELRNLFGKCRDEKCAAFRQQGNLSICASCRKIAALINSPVQENVNDKR